MKTLFPFHHGNNGAALSTRDLKSILSILFTTILLACGSVFAADNVDVSSIQKDASTANWHQLNTTGGIQLYYQYVDCGPVEYVQFKITNTSSDNMDVSWKFKKYNGAAELPVNTDDVAINEHVVAGTSVVGACYSTHPKLSLFVRESGRDLTVTNIELSDLKVIITQ